MKKYVIRNTADIEKADVDYVNSWSWGYAYEPEVSFRIVHTDDRFIVSLRTYEKDPVAYVNVRDGHVCNDSCMEFFFSPSPDNSNGYFNFETNSNPTLYLHYAQCDRTGSVSVEWDEREFKMSTTFDKDERGLDFWQVDYEIPYAMIRAYAPSCDLSSGSVIRANVYKCGLTDQIEHYGSWNLVVTDVPSFHQPSFFGEMIIE